jgi:hypothetical protein
MSDVVAALVAGRLGAWLPLGDLGFEHLKLEVVFMGNGFLV